MTLGAAVAGKAARAKARRLGSAEDHPEEDTASPEAAATLVGSYPARAFGDRLGGVSAHVEELAASLPPGDLNRIGSRLCERFRPEVPEKGRGLGREGVAPHRARQEGGGVILLDLPAEDRRPMERAGVGRGPHPRVAPFRQRGTHLHSPRWG